MQVSARPALDQARPSHRSLWYLGLHLIWLWSTRRSSCADRLLYDSSPDPASEPRTESRSRIHTCESCGGSAATITRTHAARCALNPFHTIGREPALCSCWQRSFFYATHLHNAHQTLLEKFEREDATIDAWSELALAVVLGNMEQLLQRLLRLRARRRACCFTNLARTFNL